MNTVLKSEKAEMLREKKKQTKELRRDKLRNQHRNSRKNRKGLDDAGDKDSVDQNSQKSRRSRLKKNFGEDWESEVEYGAYNQYISESSMIDFGMLSETFNEENQNKLIVESENPKDKKRQKGKLHPIKGGMSSARSERGRAADQINNNNKGSSVRFAGALRSLNKPSSLHRPNDSFNNQNQSSNEKPKRSVMFQDLTDQRNDEPKPSARSNSVASMGGILKNKKSGGNMNYAPQSAVQIRNKKKGLKRELSKQSLQDAQALRKLQSSISRGPSDSVVSDSMSEESRQKYVINQAKAAAELAVKNRELNKQISKQRAEEYRRQEEEKEKLKNKKKKKIADKPKSKERSMESRKNESTGNWFTNMFLFCGTGSCCTSKATQNQQTDMKYEKSSQRSLADQDYQSLNDSFDGKRLSRHTAQAKLNKHDTSQIQEEKKAKKQRNTQQAEATKERKKKKNRGEIISEKDLIFSNSDRDEPVNLDMKSMRKQRKLQQEQAEAKKDGQELEKENQKNEGNKKKGKKVSEVDGAVVANGKSKDKVKKDKAAKNPADSDPAAAAAAKKPPIQKKKKQKEQKAAENGDPSQQPIQEKKQKVKKNDDQKPKEAAAIDQQQDQDGAAPAKDKKTSRKKSESKSKKLKEVKVENVDE